MVSSRTSVLYLVNVGMLLGCRLGYGRHCQKTVLCLKYRKSRLSEHKTQPDGVFAVLQTLICGNGKMDSTPQ